MKILIIEDEEPNYIHLEKMLSRIRPDDVIVGPLKSLVQVKQYLTDNDDIDLIISDIRLQDGAIFDAFDALQAETSVIFTTAYDDYGIKAFSYNSVAYLMKPIAVPELSKAIDKALRLSQPLKELSLLAAQGNNPFRRRFLIQKGDSFEVVRSSDVACFVLDSGIITMYDRNGKKFHISETLDELESQLDPDNFFRINRQCIINADHVNIIRRLSPRKLDVRIDVIPDESFSVSKERANAFKAWLNR